VDAAVTGVAMAALVADGILAGLSLDKVIVQLPARRRIGVTAYAAYARAADLGNGIAFYPAVGVGAAVLTVAAFAVAAIRGAPGAVTGLLAAAALLSLVHSAMTRGPRPPCSSSAEPGMTRRPWRRCWPALPTGQRLVLLHRPRRSSWWRSPSPWEPDR
jgi:hypothetical protein